MISSSLSLLVCLDRLFIPRPELFSDSVHVTDYICVGESLRHTLNIILLISTCHSKSRSTAQTHLRWSGSGHEGRRICLIDVLYLPAAGFTKSRRMRFKLSYFLFSCLTTIPSFHDSIHPRPQKQQRPSKDKESRSELPKGTRQYGPMQQS